MKLKQLLLAIASALMLGAATEGAAATGYVNTTFQPGDNWFGNPLNSTPNTLSALIPTAPSGTAVSFWNSTLNQFTPVSTFTGTGWSTDLTLNPGTGALLSTPSQFLNTFVGGVLDFNGNPADLNNWHQPPLFAGPNGLYLLSSKVPVLLSGHVFDPNAMGGDPIGPVSVFESIIGRAPNEGEQVTTEDALTLAHTTTTFHGGVWDNGDPSLGVGQAAMFDLGPVAVPEPSAVGLLAVGLSTLGIARRRLHSGV